MTEKMFQQASGGYLTLEEARALLQAHAYVRYVDETLERYCGTERNSRSLRDRVVEVLRESDPEASTDTLSHRVDTWFRKKYQLISRRSALQIIFGLHMKGEEGETALKRLCGEGFHWRDPQDLVWIFALEKGMGYPDACRLQERMKPLYTLPRNAPADETTMTESVRNQMQGIETEEELAAFLRESAPHLGRLHNTAFQLFSQFMTLLEEAPVLNRQTGERVMKTPEILATYLYDRLLPHEEKGEKPEILRDAVARDIRENWPGEFMISRMRQRSADVNRKTLILLFLACDGGESPYGDTTDRKKEDVFEDTCERLNQMLSDCGFPAMDSRNPFDWMVLYCMVAEEPSDIDDHMAAFLSTIFRDGEGEEDT